LLTRIDASVILERLLARFPDWEIAGTPTPLISPFVQGMIELPLRFRAA
jgi:cytochrome P450